MKLPSKVGFIVNPIAGMGGRVGLKGTDGVVAIARELGGEDIAQARAESMLKRFRLLQHRTHRHRQVNWYTCTGTMGFDALKNTGFKEVNIVHTSACQSSREDTLEATGSLLVAGVDIIVFCGGDGTARDICSVVGDKVPVLGIPSGVKMYSGLFGGTPEQSAEILRRFLDQELGIAEVDVLDLDEEAFRDDRWVVRLFQQAKTPYAANLTQSSKAVISSQDDTTAKLAIAEYLGELVSAQYQCLFLLGPGSTVQAIANNLSVHKTLLGIDAMVAGRVVHHDVNEAQILALLDRFPSHQVILSPIGAQGFVLGRGNLPISASVIRRIGITNIVIVATPAKLASLDSLRFDTGDSTLDAEITRKGYIEVITGYHRSRMVPA